MIITFYVGLLWEKSQLSMDNIHIKSIEVVNKSFPSNTFKVGFKIDLDQVNILVGDQGAGKSGLLRMLHTQHSDLKLTLSESTFNKGVKTYYFDTEKHNPRASDINSVSTPTGQSRGIGIEGLLLSKFKSHGEVMRDIVLEPLTNVKDSVVLLDEPESGLSVINQYRLIDTINIAMENGNQLFIATHCIPLIENFDVISLDHMRKMSGEEYLNKIKQQ